MKFVSGLLMMVLAVGGGALAQSGDSKAGGEKPETKSGYGPVDTRPMKTFYLTNATQANDANEIVTTMRIMIDPGFKVFLTTSTSAITVRGSEEQIALAERIIHELDRPKRVFRLTYTITESDGGKRIGVQHTSMVLADGARTTLKQGSKVPIVTGSYDQGKNGAQTQMTYLDVGLSFDWTVNDVGGGLTLKSKVEQSGISEEKSALGGSDPIVRQTVLEGTSELVLNKPMILGSLDMPGTTRHLDVEVLAEVVK